MGNEAAYGRIVAARCRAGFDVSTQETVWTPKPGHVGRYRPIATLPLQYRVVFRSLVQDLLDGVPAVDRSQQAQEAFQQAPLDARHAYVVVADVASFYFYVDHELLETRIVETTARADTAVALRTLLASSLWRSYGIPQNYTASDFLSELYISPIERRLIRQGITTYRHNDDFRLGAESWGLALRALETLQSELGAIGLDLNGEKSWILKAETYERNIQLSTELFDAAFAQVAGPVLRVDPYTGEPVSDNADLAAPDAETILEVVSVAFNHAVERQLSNEPRNPFQVRADRRVIATSLQYFARFQSPGALMLGPRLVAVDPLLASPYSLYLGRLAPTDESTETSDRVLQALEAFRGYAPHWSQAWLFDALLNKNTQLTPEVTEWAREFLHGSAPSVLRVRAALALAIHEEITPQALASQFDEFAEAARPDLTAALAYADGVNNAPSPESRSVIEGEHLYRWIYEHAQANPEDASWT